MKKQLLLCIPLLGLLLVFGEPLANAAELALRDVEFTAKCDNTPQRYILGLSENFDGSQEHDLLIALHGHGSDRWQFAKDPRDECRAARDTALRYGLIFVSPDYRAKTSWMGPKAEADLLQILDEIKKQFRIRKVFICGGSMGGSSALTFTALHPDRIDGVAAMNGTANHLEYDQFQDAIKESYGGDKKDIPLEYKNRSAEYWPERFTMPVGLTTGGKDTVVPPDSVRRLAAVLKTLGRPVMLIHREEGGHATTYEDGAAILEFMLQNGVSPRVE